MELHDSTEDTADNEVHRNFMSQALLEAEIALAKNEVPVGCVFVNENKEIIARGHNKTNETFNATQHAELVAINSALLTATPSLFHNSTLYVSCEPCIMCAAAIAKLKIKEVYFGCHNDRFGGNGSILSLHLESSQTGHSYPVHSGLMKDKAIEVFQRFYECENRRAPESKRRKKE